MEGVEEGMVSLLLTLFRKLLMLPESGRDVRRRGEGEDVGEEAGEVLWAVLGMYVAEGGKNVQEG